MTAVPPPDGQRLGRGRVRIVRADLTTLACDGIVNAANTHLWMGGGVAGAIKRRGGEEIEREAVRQGPIAVGQAVATNAGRLPCRYVIHAATMGQDLATSEAAIAAATRSAFALAERLRLRALAFPALGTGVGGFPVERAARVMLAEAAAHLARAAWPAEVVVALLDDRSYQAFVRALDDVAGGAAPAGPEAPH
jgi:O-acetyl-ADP-ribose deacetylase (regulator of RNase III)